MPTELANYKKEVIFHQLDDQYQLAKDPRQISKLILKALIPSPRERKKRLD